MDIKNAANYLLTNNKQQNLLILSNSTDEFEATYLFEILLSIFVEILNSLLLSDFIIDDHLDFIDKKFNNVSYTLHYFKHEITPDSYDDIQFIINNRYARISLDNNTFNKYISSGFVDNKKFKLKDIYCILFYQNYLYKFLF